MYRILEQKIKIDCTREKETFLTQKCAEIERLDGRDTRVMFDEIRG